VICSVIFELFAHPNTALSYRGRFYSPFYNDYIHKGVDACLHCTSQTEQFAVCVMILHVPLLSHKDIDIYIYIYIYICIYIYIYEGRSSQTGTFNFTGVKMDASVAVLHVVVSGECVLLLIGGAHVAGQSRDS